MGAGSQGMTPLEIEILFHYQCRAGDYRWGDFSAPAVRAAIDSFKGELGRLELNDGAEKSRDDFRTYRLTERAQVYIRHICGQPLPEQRWQMPDNVSALA